MQQTLSTQSLVKMTILSIALAAVVLVTLILPAEYNIDPTGLGEKLGIRVLAQPAPEVIEVDTTDTATNAADVIEVTVPAGRGVEYKFYMAQFAKMEYEWQTDGDALYFDLHGEPEGDTTGYFESYAITTSNEMKGSYTTPFAGSHGWYWKNNTDKPVVVTLNVKGDYQVIGLKQ